MANFNKKIYVMDGKNWLSGKHPKMLLWTWIFQNGPIFLIIHCRYSKPSHICGFNTHMLKYLHFCRKFEFSNNKCFHMSLGITYPKFIILGKKFGSIYKKSIFWEKNWKSAKKLKIGHISAVNRLRPKPFGVWRLLGSRVQTMPKLHGYRRTQIPAHGYLRKKWPLKYFQKFKMSLFLE